MDCCVQLGNGTAVVPSAAIVYYYYYYYYHPSPPLSSPPMLDTWWISDCAVFISIYSSRSEIEEGLTRLVLRRAENDEKHVDDVDVELERASDVLLGTELIRTAADHLLSVEHQKLRHTHHADFYFTLFTTLSRGLGLRTKYKLEN